MKIVYRDGFEIGKYELDKKSIEELYDIHCDLVMSYSHKNDRGELDKLENYIDSRVAILDTQSEQEDA